MSRFSALDDDVAEDSKEEELNEGGCDEASMMPDAAKRNQMNLAVDFIFEMGDDELQALGKRTNLSDMVALLSEYPSHFLHPLVEHAERTVSLGSEFGLNLGPQAAALLLTALQLMTDVRDDPELVDALEFNPNLDEEELLNNIMERQTTPKYRQAREAIRQAEEALQRKNDELQKAQAEAEANQGDILMISGQIKQTDEEVSRLYQELAEKLELRRNLSTDMQTKLEKSAMLVSTDMPQIHADVQQLQRAKYDKVLCSAAQEGLCKLAKRALLEAKEMGKVNDRLETMEADSSMVQAELAAALEQNIATKEQLEEQLLQHQASSKQMEKFCGDLSVKLREAEKAEKMREDEMLDMWAELHNKSRLLKKNL